MLQRTLPAGFIAPCLPTKTDRLPSGTEWLHEIKHDGFRVIARKQDQRVKLYSRPGNDLTVRFPLIVEALARLRPRSCMVDGEAVACGEDGIACFELIRRWDSDHSVFMWAFDLIELDGADMRRDPRAQRKASLERYGPISNDQACRGWIVNTALANLGVGFANCVPKTR